MMTIFKKHSVLMAVMAVFTFISSGAYAGFGNDGIGCKKKGQVLKAEFEGSPFSTQWRDDRNIPQWRQTTYLAAKSTIKKGVYRTHDTIINGNVHAIPFQALNSDDSTCVGGCGKKCTSGVALPQIGTQDCMEHDLCGIFSYNSDPFSADDRNCGKEFSQASDDYSNYSIITSFWNPVAAAITSVRYTNCRVKWK